MWTGILNSFTPPKCEEISVCTFGTDLSFVFNAFIVWLAIPWGFWQIFLFISLSFLLSGLFILFLWLYACNYSFVHWFSRECRRLFEGLIASLVISDVSLFTRIATNSALKITATNSFIAFSICKCIWVRAFFTITTLFVSFITLPSIISRLGFHWILNNWVNFGLLSSNWMNSCCKIKFSFWF